MIYTLVFPCIFFNIFIDTYISPQSKEQPQLGHKGDVSNVTGIKVPLSGHWIPEEQPQFVIRQLAKFIGGSSNSTNTSK